MEKSLTDRNVLSTSRHLPRSAGFNCKRNSVEIDLKHPLYVLLVGIESIHYSQKAHRVERDDLRPSFPHSTPMLSLEEDA